MQVAQVGTWPGLGVGTGSGLIQFSQVFFSSLKGPSITLLMSERLKTHTADNSSRSLRKKKRLTFSHNRATFERKESYQEIVVSKDSFGKHKVMMALVFCRVPLRGEQSVEVRAAGVARCVLRGEDIGQDVVALTAGFVLTHQLGLEEGGPTPLQSLHPSHIRLDGQGERD